MKRPDSIEDTLEQVEGFYRNYHSPVDRHEWLSFEDPEEDRTWLRHCRIPPFPSRYHRPTGAR